MDTPSMELRTGASTVVITSKVAVNTGLLQQKRNHSGFIHI